jgi:hypothetical protein
MDFEIEVTSERFDPVDDRWLGQVALLTADLRREGGVVTRRSVPQPGRKGDVGSLILALGSAGVFTAVIEAIKAFVARDDGRMVKLSWHQDGRLQSLEVGGRNFDDNVMQRVVGMLDAASGPSGSPA